MKYTEAETKIRFAIETLRELETSDFIYLNLGDHLIRKYNKAIDNMARLLFEVNCGVKNADK